MKSKNRQIHALSAHNVQRLEDERRRIARKWHDEGGQVLIGIKLSLLVVAKHIPQDMSALRSELDSLREQVTDATSHLKDLARRLRPATLDHLGIDVALGQPVSDSNVRLRHRALPDCTGSDHERDTLLGRTTGLVGLLARCRAFDSSSKMMAKGFEVNQSTQGLGLLGMRFQNPYAD